MPAPYMAAHNLQFVSGADFSNFVVESLTTNPTVLDSAGRIFYQETDKRFSITTLDGGGAVVLAQLAEQSHVDAVSSALSTFQGDVAAATGATLVGVTGVTSGSTTLSTGTLQAVVAEIAAAIENASQSAGTFEADIADQTAGKGTALVGYAGHTASDFTVAAGDLETSLDTVVDEISAVKVTAAALATNLTDNYLSRTTTDNQSIASSLLTVSGDLRVEGNVTVVGSAFETQSEVVTFADNILLLNSNIATGVPTENAGLAVSRGDEGELEFLLFNETNQRVEASFWDATANAGAGAFVMQAIASEDYTQAQLTLATDAVYAELAATAAGKGSTLVGYAGKTVGSTVVALGTVTSALDALVAEIEGLRTGGGDLSGTVDAVIAATGLNGDGTFVTFASGSAELQAASTLAAGIAAVDANLEQYESDNDSAVADTNSRVDNLVSQINAGVETFQSGAPALTHVFAHNLNDAFVSSEVWIQDADTVYRKHVVFEEATDDNTITVKCGDARNVRIVARASTAVAAPV